MNQRLRKVVNELKNQRKVYSDADFARIVDIPRGDLSQMMSGKRKVSKRCVSNLLAEFPEINEEWLMTGEGEMLKNIDSSQDNSPVLADNHSTAVNGYQNIVNSDPTIAKLIDELAAQRRLTESVQEALLTALKQNTMLISKLK
jgi:plasmid maintenance system antidote protein VapI